MNEKEMFEMSKVIQKARVKAGINTATGEEFYYSEVRLAPRDGEKGKWALITDGKKWVTHPTREDAQAECDSLVARAAISKATGGGE